MEKVFVALWCLAGLTFSAGAEIIDDQNRTQPARFDYRLPESIEMPGGEIYYHPKVVEVRPNGISIMHDHGVAFWPFDQLPPKIAAQFHYNAAAAQKYTDELLLRRQKIDELKVKQQIADQHRQVYRDLVSQRYQCTYLRMKIDALKRRIASDKNKEQRLDNDIRQDRRVVAGEAASSGSNFNSNGFWTTSGNSGDSARMAVIGEFNTDWKNDKTDYEMWDFAANAAADNLAVYEEEYREAENKRKSLEQQWTVIQKSAQQNPRQLDREIHETVKKEVDDGVMELQKLRDMRNRQLITADEYIRKKAEILKRF